jgi:uncharacterized protein YjbI with pentapeptide repeats
MVGFSLQVGAFSELDLEKANEGCINSSQRSGCKLSGANLTGENLAGTIFCKTRMPDGTKNNSGC